MRQERRDQRHVFGLALALGAGGLLVAVAALATALASVHDAPVGPRPAVIVGLHFTYPTLNTAEALLLALAALGAAVVTIGVKATGANSTPTEASSLGCASSRRSTVTPP